MVDFYSALDKWFLDKVFVKIGGSPMYLCQAIDGEGEVLDVLVQKRKNITVNYNDRMGTGDRSGITLASIEIYSF